MPIDLYNVGTITNHDFTDQFGNVGTHTFRKSFLVFYGELKFSRKKVVVPTFFRNPREMVVVPTSFF
ncbi:hypothetical protein LEP1GSC021_3143 [Leptospira noguchii str. 1993005606]|nr:hypothetical protein LEP1GSC021_3143 [Leptospira noguchii str. 1993005606]